MLTQSEVRPPGRMTRYEKPVYEEPAAMTKCPHCGAIRATVEEYDSIVGGKLSRKKIIRCKKHEKNNFRIIGCGYTHIEDLETGEMQIIAADEEPHKWRGKRRINKVDTLEKSIGKAKEPGNGKSSGLIQPEPKNEKNSEKNISTPDESEMVNGRPINWDIEFPIIAELRKKNTPWAVIAARYGVDKHTISVNFFKVKSDRQNGIKSVRPKKYHKWTKEDYCNITKMKKEGKSWQEIAAHYNITYSCITSIWSILKSKYGEREISATPLQNLPLSDPEEPLDEKREPKREPETESEKYTGTDICPINGEILTAVLPGRMMTWEDITAQTAYGFQSGWEARGRDMKNIIAAIKQKSAMESRLAAMEIQREFIIEAMERSSIEYYSQIHKIGEDITKLREKIILYDETQKLEV